MPADVAGITTVLPEGTAAEPSGLSGPAAGNDEVADEGALGVGEGAVDLAPRQAATSPVGALAALVLVTALGLTSVVVNRRVRREAQPDP